MTTPPSSGGRLDQDTPDTIHLPVVEAAALGAQALGRLGFADDVRIITAAGCRGDPDSVGTRLSRTRAPPRRGHRVGTQSG